MTIQLPLESESIRCVEFAKSVGLDPGGTALAPDVVVLVEVDEPWPKPVGKHDAMVELVRATQERPEQIRLLAAVPTTDQPHRVIVFRPTPTGMQRSERLLCADPIGALNDALDDVDAPELASADGVTTMLVCTQGSHDVCCGIEGLDFARWAESSTDVEVFRVSHTGGHRFSPTAMTLPDGRMWAFLDEAAATSIVRREQGEALADRCRGWWGAPTGPAQIGERAVFADLGFALDALERTVQVTEVEGGSFVEIAVGDDVYEVTVVPGRSVPTIACEAPGGQPLKPGQEWTITDGPTLRSAT